MTIDSSVISNNCCGGGVFTSGGSLTVTNSKIQSNVSDVSADFNSGAGLTSDRSVTFIIDSDISYNVTQFPLGPTGGGLASYGTLFLINSTVSNNLAGSNLYPESPGGFLVRSGPVSIVNSTIANNSCGHSSLGCGVVSGNDYITLANTIIAKNLGTTDELNVAGSVISNGNNLIGAVTGSSGWIASDLLNTDPLLGPLADNGGGTFTHALLGCSPE